MGTYKTEKSRQAQLARNREFQRKKRQQNKELVISTYGGKCACCGETEMAFLVLDHVENNGAEHRREIGQGVRKIGSGSVIHAWLIKNNFPDGFQVLCANCNTAKQSGVCPHAKVAQR